MTESKHDLAAPRGAVFLSYAREDADAARRIAEALRGFGVEVWFDQSELRGGDAWDTKIRGQIKTCTLFIPVISATTQARDEAYFRLEWKLADDRSQLMAAGKAFIVPVVIDATPEAGAIVPESFARAQWTRLAAGEPTTAFIERVKHLLEAPRHKPALKPDLPRPPTLPPEFRKAAREKAGASLDDARGRDQGAPLQKKVPPVALAIVLAVVAIGVAAVFIITRKPAPPPAAPTVQAPSLSPSPSTPAPSAAVGKSIAVLPFANMSADKENDFLADGIHEDVLTSLAKIRDLKVISRTSVLAYRDTAARNLKKIAADLGVAVVLEGSVRRSGSKVRVTAQLIDARTDEHLWAENYDGDTGDVFALQAKLAQQIATALKATLTPDERSLIERRPTQDAQAYEFYQRAKLLRQRFGANTLRADYDATIALYEQALARDPQMALAHGDLAFVHGVMYWFGAIDPTPERRALAAASLAEARRLAPEAPETRVAQGAFAYLCENDWPKALAEFTAAEASLPNDDQLRYLLGITYRRLGRWSDAVAQLERSVELNPHERRAGTSYIETLFCLHRYAQLPALAPRLMALFPDDSQLPPFFIDAQFVLDGDRAAWRQRRDALPPLPPDTHGLRKAYATALRAGDLAAADRILADPRDQWLAQIGGVIRESAVLLRAELARLRGDQTAARKFAEAVLKAYASQRWSPRQEPSVRVDLARARVCAGEDGATKELWQAMEAVVRQDKFLGVTWLNVAGAYAAAGHPEEALAALRQLFAGPSTITPAELRDHPWFASLKADPRFEEILKSAKPL
ncbi:MAG: TIR domain-containing protein [Opitutaceae bacterium]|nr:TIR domain-containing protein [Opitutaceae bacterium]